MSLLLYTVAFAVLLTYGLHLLWLSYRYAGEVPRSRVKDRFLVRETGFLPAVTVQLPVYNEAYVVERLIDACARLDYPPKLLEIQVLDDSTDVTSDLAAERVQLWHRRGVQIEHIRRKSRTGFKAGALANGLRLASGSLIAIFDADFLPSPPFLRQLVPHLADPTVGMVQARWVHPDAGQSVITRIQSFGLDAHFALEQWVRDRLGYFINFNGTGGIWRRQAIEEAGGWSSATLTEDLDLSYRAQLVGWHLKYAHDVEIAADLPGDMASLRTQQVRWTRGAVETARSLLGRLWRSSLPVPVKVEGTFHLTGHLVFPFVLLSAVLHAPLVRALSERGGSETVFAALSVGVFGFAGFLVAHAIAQRNLYPDWIRRLATFPLFIAGTIGISLSNTIAVTQALLGISAPFVRTPKFGPRDAHDDTLRYGRRRFPFVAWLEAGVAIYLTLEMVSLARLGLWGAVPIQAFFAFGFLLIVGSSLSGLFRGSVERRRPARASG